MDQRKNLGHLAGLTVLLATSAAAAQVPMDYSTSSNQFQRIEQPIAVKAGIAIAGVAFIGLELWWFLLSKPKTQEQTKSRDRAVEH